MATAEYSGDVPTQKSTGFDFLDVIDKGLQRVIDFKLLNKGYYPTGDGRYTQLPPSDRTVSQVQMAQWMPMILIGAVGLGAIILLKD